MKRTAFSLIELLVVIAIIGILAAIAFPVFARAKNSAYKSSDISSMNALRTALQLYRVDQGAYPPALLGYVTLYDSGPDAGNVIPADRLQGALYPKRIDSISTLRPSYNRSGYAETDAAVWPSADSRAVGSAPILDLNGDGLISNLDDASGARQAYGPGASNDNYFTSVTPFVTNDVNDAARFYRVSGYEMANVRIPGGGTRNELRYALFWTTWGLGILGPGQQGNANDDPRQLGYNDPPENTVITWNSYFRDYDGSGNLSAGKAEVVLFLGGAARPYDQRAIAERSWRVLP